MAGNLWGEGPRGGIFGARVDPALLRELEKRAEAKRQMAQGLEAASGPGAGRIAGAFEAADGMQEPSRALYEAKHRRAQGLPPETSFLEDVASLGPSIRGGLKAIADPRTSPIGPAAIARMFFDPAGEAGRQVETGRQLVEPFTQFNDPRVNPVKQGADLALTVMGGSSVVPAAANELRMGIKAYHGSPHDFERFDASKIGTGEGAQAYGHGLYFAEREGVARDYRDQLSKARTTFSHPDLGDVSTDQLDDILLQEVYRVAPNKEKRLADMMAVNAVDALKEGDDFNAMRRWVREQGGPPEDEAAWMSVLKKAEEFKPKSTKGSMYEVDIAAEPEQFLDWDKPLSEQSPQVREAIERQVRSRPGAEDVVWRHPETGEEINLSQLQGMERDVTERTLKKQGYGKIQPRWQHDMESMGPQSAAFGEDRVAQSQALREAGIPGIRYLDQGSRGAVDVANIRGTISMLEGAARKHPDDASIQQRLASARQQLADAEQGQTRNYVVFDDKLISILKKYGLPISAAGLAALTQLHPEEAKAAQRKDSK